jgi:hypothetical protein
MSERQIVAVAAEQREFVHEMLIQPAEGPYSYSMTPPAAPFIATCRTFRGYGVPWVCSCGMYELRWGTLRP